MACFLTHDWGWPRRRKVRDIFVDVQTCTRCGATRIANVQFGAKPAMTSPIDKAAPKVLYSICSRGAR